MVHFMRKTQDWYFKRAKSEGYRSRAVYKLIEIQEHFHLFGKKQRILDIGAFPGSWTQYLARVVGKGGLVIAVDVQKIDAHALGSQCLCFKGDFTQDDVGQSIAEYAPYHGIVSDAAAATCGVHMVDAAQSLNIAFSVIQRVQEFLLPGGHCVMKILEGGDTQELVDALSTQFNAVKRYKPRASRVVSSEIYIVATQYRKDQHET